MQNEDNCLQIQRQTDVVFVSHDVGVDNGPWYRYRGGVTTGMRNSAVDIPISKVGRCQIDLQAEGE